MEHLGYVLSALSAAVAVASLIIAVLAFRRTSRLQDADYRPLVAFHHSLGGMLDVDREDVESEEGAFTLDNCEIWYSGSIVNVGQKPAHMIKAEVFLGPRKRDDPECALTIPLNRTEAPGGKREFDFSLAWATIWSVACHFKCTSLDWTLVLTLRGADGVTRDVRSMIGTLTQCEGEEWAAIETYYFAEVLSDLQQARLRQRTKIKAASDD